MVNHKIHKSVLRSKGWSDGDIRSANHILSGVSRPPAIRFLDSIIFWILLFMTIMGVVLLGLLVIPLLLFLPELLASFFIIILFLSLGSLFALVSGDMHWVGVPHHISAFFALFLTSLFSFFIINVIAGKFFGLILTHTLWFGLCAAFGVLAPYFFMLFFERRRRFRN